MREGQRKRMVASIRARMDKVDAEAKAKLGREKRREKLRTEREDQREEDEKAERNRKLMRNLRTMKGAW